MWNKHTGSWDTICDTRRDKRQRQMRREYENASKRRNILPEKVWKKERKEQELGGGETISKIINCSDRHLYRNIINVEY